MRIIGLMSGTSLDGIDVACIETDGERIIGRGPVGLFYPYSLEMQQRIRAALNAEGWRPEIHTLEADITSEHVRAVEAYLTTHGLDPQAIDLVGFHGQTIAHHPDLGVTWQLGDGKALAAGVGIPVVYNFRAADVAAGGQGAPLVPAYHQALFSPLLETYGAIVCLNIGGVANMTYLDADTLLAGDVGPGCALLNDWMMLHGHLPLDLDGAAAAEGQPDAQAVSALLAHSFFRQPFPKSLDRNAFETSLLALRGKRVEDGARVLTDFTVGGILTALRQLPPVGLLCLMGGGRHNKTLVHLLAEGLNRENFAVQLLDIDHLAHPLAPLSGDFMEAEAFAFLAARAHRKLPLSWPSTTGVKSPTTGGVWVLP